MFYIEKINLQNNKDNETCFIFENNLDSSLSFNPITVINEIERTPK